MPATPGIEAPLIEVFSSMQGEGVLIGCRQIFVRFADCNLDCAYCDTNFQAGPSCQIESSPGSGCFEDIANPVNLHTVSTLISGWQHLTNNAHHSLVLTGGEPLLHADLLRRWLPEVRPLLPVFLETNGTLPDELEMVLSLVDYVSMDIKGATVTGVETPWGVHADFLSKAKGSLCQVKLVVGPETTAEELLESARLANKFAPEVPFVMQPLTLPDGLALDGATLLDLQKIAAREHRDVRIIPQIHPWIGVA